MEISSYQDCLKCSKHPNQNIIFIQVNQLQENKHLFYCESCILYDEEYKTSNYIQFKQVLESPDGSNIVNWPPFEDNSIKNLVNKMLSKEQNQSDLISQIYQFFDDMKKEVIQKIDDCQKQMIRKAQEVPQYENQIKEKLKEIKIVDQFKNIMLNSNSKMNVKERQWREFMNKAKKEQKKYTKEIKNMFDLLNQNQTYINFETPNKMKASILQLIEDINFFQNENENENKNENKNKSKSKINEQKQLKNINLLPRLMIIQSNFRQNDFKNQKLKKLENNSIQIISSHKNWGSYYSNQILDRNKKYIFRFQYKKKDQNDGGFMIGLIRDKIKDTEFIFEDKLSFFISYTQINKGHLSGDGIDKQVKGDLSDAIDIDCLELRVCIQDELLDVVDYPNYNHKYSITDEYKTKLQTYKNLRLGIYLVNTMQLTLRRAQICDKFKD